MATTKWVLDPTHSELGFKIKHLMITNVTGTFRNFQGEIETENADFTSAKIKLTAQMDSISTNNEQRDAHLRNADFFEVDKYPELQFSSTRIEKTDDETFTVHGNLTMKGITKPVKLNAEFNGLTKDPWGGERAGFVVTGKIKRSEWGVTFNSTMETGGIMLGEEVKLESEIQLVKQAEKAAA
jgi:polyisoprenoid-binding protein YceI